MMTLIKKLHSADKEIILNFCYKREKENLFVIGAFGRFVDPFEEVLFYGYFEKDRLMGLATYFRLYENFIINADNDLIIEKLVDFVFSENPQMKIDCIAVFKKYGDVMVRRLKEKYNLAPKKMNEEYVMILDQKNFNDFSKGSESIAHENDIEDIVLLGRMLNNKDILAPITSKEKKRIKVEEEFILRINQKIISIANIHGVSKNYFQIGGVITRPNFRNKGYSKQVVSFLCQKFFDKGIKTGFLFTDKNNKPAQAVYRSLGFEIVDDFILAEY